MAKKKSETREKPKEILDLERAYGVVLEEATPESDFDYMPDKSFTLNNKGGVSGLRLVDCGIINTSPISNLTELEYLALSANNIESLLLIKKNNLLAHLYLGGNKIGNIDFLKNCPNLINLVLWRNPIENIDEVMNLKKLEGLFCEGIGNFDFKFIRDFKNLRRLNLGGNGLNKIPEMSLLKSIIELQLKQNSI